jgi:hypothetical protein
MSFFACFSTKKKSKAEEHTTRTGKDIWAAESSDLVGGTKSTMPPLAVLKRCPAALFTDTSDRAYWLASDVQKATGWKWEKGISIQQDGSLFKPTTDEIYYVRNQITRGKTPAVLLNPPPEKNLEAAALFLQGESEYKGFIVDSGEDEVALDLKSSRSYQNSTPRVRQTSYVVIRWVDGKRPARAAL